MRPRYFVWLEVTSPYEVKEVFEYPTFWPDLLTTAATMDGQSIVNRQKGTQAATPSLSFLEPIEFWYVSWNLID